MGAFGASAGRGPSACPCGSGTTYHRCCAPLHRGEQVAVTAVALMRSRYAAFAVGDPAYLLRTWHPRTRPADLDLPPVTWTGLEVLGHEAGGEQDERGRVRFRARWTAPGPPRQHGEQVEDSRFERRGGRWVYVDGDAG